MCLKYCPKRCGDWTGITIFSSKVGRAFNKTLYPQELWQVFCHGSLAKISAAPYKGEVFSTSYIALSWVVHKGSHLLKFLLKATQSIKIITWLRQLRGPIQSCVQLESINENALLLFSSIFLSIGPGKPSTASFNFQVIYLRNILLTNLAFSIIFTYLYSLLSLNSTQLLWDLQI